MNRLFMADAPVGVVGFFSSPAGGAFRADGTGAEAGGGAEGAGSDAHKFRRLFEDREEKLRAAGAELERYRAAERARGEAERAAAEQSAEALRQASERAERAEQALLKRRVTDEVGLPAAAAEYLQGADEAEIAAAARRLKEIGFGVAAASAPASPGAGAAVVAGTPSAPPRHQGPSIDEQIAAAAKAGQTTEAIRLKRVKAGFGAGAQE